MTLPVEQFSYLSWMKSDLRIEEFSVESLQVTPLNISAKVWFNELDRIVLEMHISRMFQFEKLWYSAVKFTETCRDKIKSNYTFNIKLAPKIIIYKKKIHETFIYKGRIAFRGISKQKTLSAAVAKIDIHNYLLR